MAVEETWTVEALFNRGPGQLELFYYAAAAIEALGEVGRRVTRSQVSFRSGRQFAWLWPPPQWARNRTPGCIVLSFALGRRAADERIVQAVEPYPGRWMHHVILEQATDLDELVQGWLKEAYVFGLNKKGK
jgi:hypothetical protein